MFKNKSFRISLILSFLFLTCGFILLHYSLVEYGIVFFVFLPIVVGLSIGALPNKLWSLLGLVITLLCMVYGLIAVGLEGAVCGLMALGILLLLMFLGEVIGHFILLAQKGKGTTNLKILSAPFLLFLFAAPVENAIVNSPEIIPSKTVLTR